MRKLFAALSLLAMPTLAQAGFLDELFGIRPQSVPSPSYGAPDEDGAPRQIAPEKTPRLPVMEVAPQLQEATCCKHGEDPMQALLNDRTLVRGDVVMTTEGLRTFVGSRPPHAARDFVPIGTASALSAERKRQLLALDR